MTLTLDHPRSVAREQLDERLAELKWSNLRDSSDVAELERFVQRFPQSRFKPEAGRRIEAIRSTQSPKPPPLASESASALGLAANTGATKIETEAISSDVGRYRRYLLAGLAALGIGCVGLIIANQGGQDLRREDGRRDTTVVVPPTVPPPPMASSTTLPAAPPVVVPPRPLPPPPSFNTFASYDIDQHDLDIKFNISYSACRAACQSTSACVGFVFDKWKNACYLKDQIGPLIRDPHYDAVIRTDQSWPVLSTAATETCLYHQSSMMGEVARSFASPSANACKSECEGDQKCVAYTFARSKHRCDIFSSVSNRVTHDPDGESGARMQNSC